MADTLDFLLEIGTEEMPSAPLINASKQLPKLVVKMLDEAGLAHGDVRVVSSPRRLAAIVSDVACATEAVHEVKRGPKAQIAFDADGNPTKAAAGFARKCGIDASELTRKVDEDGNEYVFAERNVPSEPAMPILSALGHDVIAAIEWPNYRSQRWGSEHETFVRPIRWICALLGSRGHARPHLRRGREPLRVADRACRHLRRGVPPRAAGDYLRVHALQPALFPDFRRRAQAYP